MMIYLSILGVLILSAFFSASEIAFISADRLRIELEKAHTGWYTRMQSLFFARPGQFITTMLVGNNIALVVYGLLMASVLEPILAGYLTNSFLIVLFQTIISTIIILIFAEFIPKAVSKLNPNNQIRNFAFPLFLLYVILYPIAAFATWISKVFFVLFRVKGIDEDTARLGKVDLDNYIEVNSQSEEFSLNNEVRILQNALEFSDVKIRDCLIPRNEIIACDSHTSKEELIRTFDRTGYSKILIYNETIDDITGYIHAIEMFKCKGKWQDHINTTIYIPETIPADKVMRMLMQKKKSIAVVVDELGGTAGIVTLEDIVEEIFGDIEDEHDVNSVIIRKIGDFEYLLSGRAEIDDINEEFGLDLPSSDEYKTVAGMILHYYQGFPKRGEDVLLPSGIKIKVIRSTDNKINLVKLNVETT